MGKLMPNEFAKQIITEERRADSFLFFLFTVLRI